VEKHKALHERIDAVEKWAEKCEFNWESGAGEKGIVGGGFAFKKLIDVIEEGRLQNIRLLKLGVLYPLPNVMISNFLRRCREIMVVEETEPFLETQIKAIAQEMGEPIKVMGKNNRHLAREGELFRWQIQRALTEFIPGFAPDTRYMEENESFERPTKKNHCTECRYDEVLDALEDAAESLGQKPLLIGDPGCLVSLADRLDAKFALGSAVGVADGLSKVGIEERAVAIFGDSSFFHSSLPAICNAVHNRSDILMVVLDNQSTATSGFQPHPGVGRDALGKETLALDMEKIARVCGVKNVFRSGLDEEEPALVDVFRKTLGLRELTLIIVRIE
jgi:indolepyruvate ferredoxin oxidoreductase alpha subunit